MSPADLILDAESIGVRLVPAGDKLRVLAPPSLPKEQARTLIERLRQHKGELMALLAGPPRACYCCMGGDFWRAEWGTWVCVVCHPDPLAGTERARPVRSVVGYQPLSGRRQ